MSCASQMVTIARSYAPSDYPSQKYLEAVLPFDTSAFQMAAGQPYPKGMSSCAIFALANYARLGYRAKGIGEPYQPHMGQAEALLVDFGKQNGALETNPDPTTFEPGDVFHIGNASHWGVVTEPVANGKVQSVDGGQPGVAERIRTIGKSGGTWTLDGRPVLHVIKASKLGIPCADASGGWMGVGLAVVLGTITAALLHWVLA